MKKFLKVFFKILKWLFIMLSAAIVLFLVVRFIGQKIYSRTPEGGINEEMYVDINGVKQWISIYGQDKDNPVLLYLHGGPGSSTSTYDFAFTRKWSDVYTVVTWDQRNCGKSYSSDQNDTTLTYDLMMSDGVEMTKYLLDYLGKDNYNINGDKDYQTNYLIAQDYFELVNAPRKKMYIMKDTTHGLLESKSEEFSDMLHEIAQKEHQI